MSEIDIEIRFITMGCLGYVVRMRRHLSLKNKFCFFTDNGFFIIY